MRYLNKMNIKEKLKNVLTEYAKLKEESKMPEEIKEKPKKVEAAMPEPKKVEAPVEEPKVMAEVEKPTPEVVPEPVEEKPEEAKKEGEEQPEELSDMDKLVAVVEKLADKLDVIEQKLASWEKEEAKEPEHKDGSYEEPAPEAPVEAPMKPIQESFMLNIRGVFDNTYSEKNEEFENVIKEVLK